MKSRVYKYTAAAAVAAVAMIGAVALATSGSTMTAQTAQASVPTAYVTLQINPALTLALDEDEVVVGTEALNDAAVAVLAAADVIGEDLDEALRRIAATLADRGLLDADHQISLVAHTAPWDEEGAEPGLPTNLATVGGDVLRDYVDGIDGTREAVDGEVVEVVSVAMSAAVYEAAAAAGLEPEDYVNLVAELGSEDALKALLDLGQAAGVDPGVFAEEFETLASAYVDMLEAGITDDVALGIAQQAVALDPSLEESTTIVAAMIDLHDEGASTEAMVAVLSLGREAGVQDDAFLEEIATVAAAHIDIIEAGGTEGAALRLLVVAAEADPKLEELTTIVAAYIDLLDEGVSEKDALDMIAAAIAADPSLDSFDDLLAAKAGGDRSDRSSRGNDDDAYWDKLDAEQEAKDAAEDAYWDKLDAEQEAKDAAEDAAEDAYWDKLDAEESEGN